MSSRTARHPPRAPKPKAIAKGKDKDKAAVIINRSTEAQQIEAWIAEHGVNKQPTKFVLATTAFVSDKEARSLIRKIKVKDPGGWRQNRPHFG